MCAKTFEYDKIGILNRWAIDSAFSLASCPTKFLPGLCAMRLLSEWIGPSQFGFVKFDRSLSGMGLAILRLNMPEIFDNGGSKMSDYFRHIGPLVLSAVKSGPFGLFYDKEGTGIDVVDGVILVDLKS